eukprot:5052373-Prymnesium_polylepis.2
MWNDPAGPSCAIGGPAAGAGAGGAVIPARAVGGANAADGGGDFCVASLSSGTVERCRCCPSRCPSPPVKSRHHVCSTIAAHW